MNLSFRPSARSRSGKFAALALAVSAVSLLLGKPARASDDVAYWLGNSGDWGDPSQWTVGSTNFGVVPSSGSQYPNAAIDSNSSSYTVTLTSDQTVDSTEIGSDSAYLLQTAGTFQSGTITLNAGAYEIDSGTLANSTVNVNGGTFNFQGGTLNNVAINGTDLVVGSGNSLDIQNGISIGDGNLDLFGNAAVYFDGPSQSVDNLNITAGASYIYASGPNSGGPQTLTLGGNTTVHDGVSFYNYNEGDGLINNGTLIADAAEGFGINIYVDNFTNNGFAGAVNYDSLTIRSANWSNAGTISADQGSRVSLYGNWSNTGLISDTNGSTLTLGGTFTTAGIGNLQVDSPSSVAITGSLDNSNATLSLHNYGGTWTLDDEGSINNGTLDVNSDIAGGTFSVVNGTLNNVNVIGGDLQVASNGIVYIQNGITIANTNLDLADYANLYFDGPSQTIDNLNITANGPTGYAYVYPGGPNSGGAATLTLGSNLTVHDGIHFFDNATGDGLINDGTLNADVSGGSGISVYIDNFINNGTAEATNGDTLYINSSSWINAGTISATGSSTVNLGGTFTTAGVGFVTADSTSAINVTGYLDNTGTTFKPAANGGNWYLAAGGEISNGTLDLSNGSFAVEQGTLNNVTVTGGDLQVAPEGNLFIPNGITFTGTNLDLAPYAYVYFDGANQTVDNVTINGASQSRIYSSGPDSTGPATLTLGSNVTVLDGITFQNYHTGDGLINNGTINANVSGGNGIDIDVDHFTNNGIAQATNGDTLFINSASWTNTGTISATGSSTVNLGGSFTTAGLGTVTPDATSSVNITGYLNNTAATFTPGSYGGNWSLDGGQIANGTLNLSSPSITVQQGALNNVTLTNGVLPVALDGNLYVTNGITGAGASASITLASYGYLYFDGANQTVNNLSISGANQARIYPSGPDSTGPATLTIGSGATILDGVQFIDYHTGDALANNGTINANLSNGYGVSIYNDHFTNNGTAEATNGDTLYIDAGSWNNAGTIAATSSTLHLGGNVTTAGLGHISADSDSAVNLSGSVDNSNATFNPANYGQATWSLPYGSITNGTLDVSSGLMNVSNGTLNGVSVVGGDLQLPANGNLQILNSISIANHNLDLGTYATLYFDGASQSVDNLNITPATTATIVVGGPNSTGSATLTLGANTTLHGGVQINQEVTHNALVNNGTINSDSTFSGELGISINTDKFINHGTAEATLGNALNINSGSFTNTGTLLANYQSTVSVAGSFSNSGHVVLSGGTLSATNKIDIGSGTLSGSGSINANVTLDSTPAPSTLSFQLLSANVFDSLTINGSMKLGGDLAATLVGGYTPTHSDSFVVVDVNNADILSGAFANVADGARLETSDGTGTFTVDYADGSYPQEVVLTAFTPAPEPGSASIFCIAGAGALLRRRRRTASA
jgi:filamentous hemagglutinin